LDAGGYSPHLIRVGTQLLTQRSDGQPQWIGTAAAPFGAKSRAWVQPPSLGDKQIFLALEKGKIAAYNQTTPHALGWTYETPFGTSLTGALCRLFSQGSVLLAAIPRNAGIEWLRLDTQNGKLIWSCS